jgi:hypothetical protein
MSYYVQCSILGRIIRVTDEVLEYRQWIRENFPLPNSPSIPRVIPLFSRQPAGGIQQIPYIAPGQSMYHTQYAPYNHFTGANASASTGSSCQSSRSSSSPPEPYGDFCENNRSAQASPLEDVTSKSDNRLTGSSTIVGGTGDDMSVDEPKDLRSSNKDDSASASSLSLASESGGNNSRNSPANILSGTEWIEPSSLPTSASSGTVSTPNKRVANPSASKSSETFNSSAVVDQSSQNTQKRDICSSEGGEKAVGGSESSSRSSSNSSKQQQSSSPPPASETVAVSTPESSSTNGKPNPNRSPNRSSQGQNTYSASKRGSTHSYHQQSYSNRNRQFSPTNSTSST